MANLTDSQTHSQCDDTRHSAGQVSDGAKSLCQDANLGKVGDNSANHSWSQMQGSGHSGIDRPAGAHMSGKNDSNQGPIDFAAFGDIYGGAKGQSPASSGHSGADSSPPIGDHPGSARASDSQGDKSAGGLAPDWARPPQLNMPSAHEVGSAPVEHLQSMAQDNGDRLRDYVDARGENIPSLGLHGTTALSGKNLSGHQGGGELWVAGPHPDRKDMGGSQYVGDLTTSMNTSMSYAENRGEKGDNTPGPVLVYDTSNQPQAWSKNQLSSAGNSVDGNGPKDEAKFGQLDLGQANLLGSVSREHLDGMTQQFAPLYQALDEKQSNILKTPGGPDAATIKDLHERVTAVNQIRGAHRASAVLDVVANSRGEW